MAAATPLLLRVMSLSVSAANKAGQIIREVMKKGELGIIEKGINDLQTEADRSAQMCIVTSLSKQFPKITIIGEENLESGNVKPDWTEISFDKEVLSIKCPEDLINVDENQVVIWVDPLDGTSEYVQGLLDHVTVLVGIAINGRAVGGVIHQPFYNYQNSDPNTLGRTVWGIIGVGARGLNASNPPEGQRIVTTTRSHSNKLVESALNSVKPDHVIKVGGAGHKVLLLMEGKAHAYVFASKGCKKWDTCAPEAILHSLGGKLTDIHGTPLQYHATVQHMNSSGVLATYSTKVHDWFVSKISQDVKDALRS